MYTVKLVPEYLIGIDEVGRGPLAGPLCLGAFWTERRKLPIILSAFRGIRDSKQLSAEERIKWFLKIRRLAQKGYCRYESTFVRAQIIDRDGMGSALRYAVRRLLANLEASPSKSFLLLDGMLRAPSFFPMQESIIHGDENEPLIAAASIIAKVRRDRYMVALSKIFPEYGFETHKGYGTRRHYNALKEFGVCRVHRRSFLKNLSLPTRG